MPQKPSDWEDIDISSNNDWEDISQPGLLQRWDEAWINQPLWEAPSRWGRDFSKSIDTGEFSESGDIGFGGNPYIRGFIGGAAEGLGDVVSGLTSPLNLLTMGAGGAAYGLGKGAQTLAQAGKVAEAARRMSTAGKFLTAEKILSAPMIGSGAARVERGISGGEDRQGPTDWKDIGFGIAEMAGGGAGFAGHLPEIGATVARPKDVSRPPLRADDLDLNIPWQRELPIGEGLHQPDLPFPSRYPSGREPMGPPGTNEYLDFTDQRNLPLEGSTQVNPPGQINLFDDLQRARQPVTTAPPTPVTPGLPDTISAKGFTPSDVALARQRGYESGGVGPDGYPIMVLKRKTPITTPPPVKLPDEGPTPFEGGTPFHEDEGFTLPKEKLTASTIDRLREQGYPLIGRDQNGNGIFKRLISDTSGTFDPRKMWDKTKEFFAEPENIDTRPGPDKEINWQPGGKPLVYDKLAIQKEMDILRKQMNRARSPEELDDVFRQSKERMRQKFGELQDEITQAIDSSLLEMAKYDPNTERKLRLTRPDLFERFVKDEEGTFDPQEMWKNLRQLLGREPNVDELDAAMRRQVQPGEETGRVAPFKGQPGSPEFEAMASEYDNQITTRGGQESRDMMPGIEREIQTERGLPPTWNKSLEQLEGEGELGPGGRYEPVGNRPTDSPYGEDVFPGEFPDLPPGQEAPIVSFPNEGPRDEFGYRILDEPTGPRLVTPELREQMLMRRIAEPEVLSAEPELDMFGYPKDRDLTPEEVEQIKREMMVRESQYFGPDTVENQRAVDDMTGTIDAEFKSNRRWSEELKRFITDEEGIFDPEALWNNLRKKLGREPTEAELIEGMQRQGAEGELPAGKWDVFDPKDGRTIQVFNSEQDAIKFVADKPHLDYEKHDPTQPLHPSDVQGNAMDDVRASIESMPPSDLRDELLARLERDIKNPPPPKEPTLDDMAQEFLEALEAGAGDGLARLGDIIKKLNDAPDITTALRNLGDIRAYVDTVKLPDQKVLFEQLYQHAFRKYHERINDAKPPTRPDEAISSANDAFSRAENLIKDGAVGDAHQIIHDETQRLKVHFPAQAESLANDWKKFVDDFFGRNSDAQLRDATEILGRIEDKWGTKPEIPPLDKWDNQPLDKPSASSLAKSDPMATNYIENIQRIGPQKDFSLNKKVQEAKNLILKSMEGNLTSKETQRFHMLVDMIKEDPNLPKTIQHGFKFDQYQLPDGNIINVDATATKSVPEMDYPLKDGTIVKAKRLIRDFFTDETGAVPISNIRKMFEGGDGPEPKVPSRGREWYNLSRGLTTTMDLSPTMRQGLPLIARKEWWTSWRQMRRSLGSEEAFQKTLSDIKKRPIFQSRVIQSGDTVKIVKSLAEQAGMKMMDLTTNLTKREEANQSNWAESGGMVAKIPGAQKAYQKTIGRGVRATNRAYTAYLNQLRADTFEALLKDAKGDFDAGTKGAMNPYTDMPFTKEIADFVNTATGRGPLRTALPTIEGGRPRLKEASFEQNAKLLSDVIFSPRLMFSRVRMLNPFTYMMASPFVRKQYVKSLLSVAGAWGTMAGLASMVGADVNTDMNSSDFGKIKIGNTRLDPAGGFQQYLVAAHRLISGRTTSSGTGQEFELGQGYRAETRKDVEERFLVNKLHPVLKFVYDIQNAAQYTPFHVMDRSIQQFVPLMVQDIVELAKENPWLLPLAIPVGLGMGTQTYGKGESVGKFIPPENDILYEGGAPNLWGPPRRPF